MSGTGSYQIDVLTLFPEYFDGPLQESLLKRGQEKGLLKIRLHQLRDYTHDRHKTADDKPFGGGPGMVMKPEPIFECVDAIRTKGRAKPWIVLLDPKGDVFTQSRARVLARKKRLVLIAGHYEGVDERVREGLADEVLSVGDYITMGGEAPALCVIEAVARLVPGVVGNSKSLECESFEIGTLEYPQYTRPREYRGMKVPEVLVSGNHGEVEAWRGRMAQKLTREIRPGLRKKDSNIKIEKRVGA
jgi:tRNA (guanine37-N1)-methyltransferase